MHNEWSLSKKKNGIRKRYKTLKHSSIGRKRRKKHPNERKLSTDIVFIETLNRLRLLQLLDLHINDVLFAAILFESLAKKFYFRIWFIEEKSLFSPKCVSRRNSIDFFLACTVSGQFNGYFLLYNWSASILSFIHEMEQKQKQLTQKKTIIFDLFCFCFGFFWLARSVYGDLLPFLFIGRFRNTNPSECIRYNQRYENTMYLPMNSVLNYLSSQRHMICRRWVITCK